MPNKHAAEKDLRKNRRHAKHNARVKSHVKTLFKGGMSFIKAGEKGKAATSAAALQQAIDKAAKNGVISKNASRRKKSALMRKLNTMSK